MTPEEVQAMIDLSIAKHNKTSTVIESFLLFFYAHGLLATINKLK